MNLYLLPILATTLTAIFIPGPWRSCAIVVTLLFVLLAEDLWRRPIRR